ncbi:hypothetical protein AQJ46_14420 [Streptomyces canus]|uniref:Large membrane protein n=1 Tax=Streptomyces canus TaxID=58343 RepID=A0A117R4M9_9ACTN|nr:MULTISPECIES: hypothetical protein [Streptomyces]KUN70856.1 hypothetical protein AQJ46_14420 [Streptomyces canus]MDI5905130.1 hypothetical protein [Streptomyces sp. 12257]
MNTERPDNDEASGGGDGSSAEARGAGALGAEETRGSDAHGDETSAGGAEGTEGTEEASAAAGGSTEHAEEAADGSPASGSVADADADEPDGPAATDAHADADTARAPTDGESSAAPSRTGLGRLPAPDTSAGPDEPVGLDTDLDQPQPPTPDTAGSGADSDHDHVPAVAALPDPDAPRSGRHRSPVVIAAVAAAVLLVGGGGAYLAASTSGGSGDGAASGASGDDTPPPLALDGYRVSGGAGNGIAPGEPNPYGTTYRVDGSLPAGPRSAPVYRTQGQVTEDDVVRLAEALGVDGTPVAQGQVWRVGTKDGSGPSLQVNRQAPGAWTFQRYSRVIDNCDSATVCGAEQTPTGSPVSVAVAEKAAAPVLKAAGQDGAKLDASQVMGAQRVVNADPVVGGLPTYGWTTGVTVNGQGEVVGGTGQLKAPVKSDTYPVLSAEKTLGLLNEVPATGHRMGIGGCASPVPLKDRLEAPCGESTASPARNTLTVEKAVFGLASHLVAGRQALVPSWLFEVRATGAKDAFTVTYPAVDPTYIASPATATPTSPATPTAPSDQPTSAPKTRDVKVDGYSAEGDELTLSFTGGVCGDYAATASETSGEVTAKVTYTPWPDKVCIMIAKEIQKTVPLNEPLGDRKVVGSDGKEIPLKKAGARLPETSGAR